MSKGDLAARYESLYPHTGIPDAQKQERMERILHKQEGSRGRRTGRVGGIVVPRLPTTPEGRLRP